VIRVALMMIRHCSSLATMVLAIAMVAAACSDDGDDDSSSATTEATTVAATAVAATVAPTAAPTAAPTEVAPNETLKRGSPSATPAASTPRTSSGAALCPDGAPTFEFAPVDLDATELVVPLGMMYGSHVTPVDHIYFQNFRDPDLQIAVYSPAAGTVTRIENMRQSSSPGPAREIDDYRLVIEHDCSLSSIFIHLATLSPTLSAVAPSPGDHGSVDVSVVAGELIGGYRANVDYNVVDTNVTLPGLLVPEHYSDEPWKIHAAPPFDYFTDEIQQRLNALSLRSEAPFDGRFDYDIDGRLVGNWFQQGTNGYSGIDGIRGERYWAGHLTVAYDHLVPSHVVLSLGTFDGASAQFGVRGNTPDPADVSVASDLIVYELVKYDYMDGDTYWDRRSPDTGLTALNDDAVRGVVLMQLLSDRVLKVEIFPGLTASDIDGFSDAALLYER